TLYGTSFRGMKMTRRNEMDWSDGLRALKRGKLLCRAGWNGKFLRITMVDASVRPVQEGSGLAAKVPVGTMVGHNAYIGIVGRDGTVTPWLPSQQDQLAEDWMIDDGGSEESFQRGSNGG